MTGTAATLLTTEFAGRARDFAALLRLRITLTLVGHILLHVQIDNVVIRFNAEDILIQSYLSTGLLTVDFQYTNFHFYFSIKRVEPLQPATLPLISSKLCSGITFNTFRFCVVTRSQPMWPPMRIPLNTLAG